MRRYYFVAVYAISSLLSLVSAATGQDRAFELFYSLFGGPTARRASVSSESSQPCVTARLMALDSFTKHQLLSAEDRDQLRSLIVTITGQGIKPTLPKTIESRYFALSYTDSDIEVSHNISGDDLKPYLEELDARYQAFLKKFGKIAPAPPAKILLDVWNFQLEPGLEDKLAFSDPNSTTINVAPSIFAVDACQALATLTHELFHRVQQAHANLNFFDQAYWVEGTAEWATLFASPRENGFLDYTKDLVTNPEESLFARDYDAALFWIYLDERYQELLGRKARGRSIDILLNRLDKGGPDTLMNTVLLPFMRSVYRADQRKPGSKKVPGASADALLMQEWHLTNFLRNIYTRKLSYNRYDEHPDDCGKQHLFPGLTARAGAGITSDDTAFSDQSQVQAAGAAYYVFTVAPSVSKAIVKVSNEPLNHVVVSSLGGKGNKVRFLKTTGNKLAHTQQLKFKRGSIDSLAIVVGGANLAEGGASTYTLTVNEPGDIAEEIRVKVVATLSSDPNDQFGDPIPIQVRVGSETVTTGGDEPARTVVPPGPISVVVESSLTDEFGREYRVGFVSVSSTLSGTVRRCAPADRAGLITFTSSISDINQDSASDYEIGVRIVPLEAGPVQNAEMCS